VRKKIFGLMTGALDREAKHRLLHRARCLKRARLITRAAYDIFASLLVGFHNGASGRCFPSYAKIAAAAGCCPRSISEALRALEACQLVTVINRLIRVRVRDEQACCWRVVPQRTSNCYLFPWTLYRAIALGTIIARLTIRPDGTGEMGYAREGSVSLRSAFGRRRALGWIVVAYGGPEAELRFAGEPVYGCEADFMMAEALAARLSLNERQVNHLIGSTARLVGEHWSTVETVARKLLEWGSLSGADVAVLAR
jgi:hypothetical protein